MAGKHKEVTWRVNENGCWICTSHAPDKNGYPRYKVGGRGTRLHRVTYEKHFGPIPRGMCVCHRCDTPSCINPAHLFLGFVADNNADKTRKGRNFIAAGEKHGQAKLTEAQVLRIVKTEGITQKALAAQYGICQQHLRRILKAGRWTHLFTANTAERFADQRCKLTEQQVAEIRAQKGQYTQREIAGMYGVSFQHVSDIMRGRKRSMLLGSKRNAL